MRNGRTVKPGCPVATVSMQCVLDSGDGGHGGRGTMVATVATVVTVVCGGTCRRVVARGVVVGRGDGRAGVSRPRAEPCWQQPPHGKPHREQCRIGTLRGFDRVSDITAGSLCPKVRVGS